MDGQALRPEDEGNTGIISGLNDTLPYVQRRPRLRPPTSNSNHNDPSEAGMIRLWLFLVPARSSGGGSDEYIELMKRETMSTLGMGDVSPRHHPPLVAGSFAQLAFMGRAVTE